VPPRSVRGQLVPTRDERSRAIAPRDNRPTTDGLPVPLSLSHGCRELTGLSHDPIIPRPHPPGGEAVLGRLDATRGVFPDVDLTPDGGLEGGVSRRHARVHQQKSQFFIEDLGSANGTFLNGQRLTPYLPHPLRDGDEVQLGRVRLRISVQ